jgi:hypothetical protein
MPSSDIMEYEGQQMKQCRIKYNKNPEKSPYENHKHIIGWSWGTPVERLD